MKKLFNLTFGDVARWDHNSISPTLIVRHSRAPSKSWTRYGEDELAMLPRSEHACAYSLTLVELGRPAAFPIDLGGAAFRRQ